MPRKPRDPEVPDFYRLNDPDSLVVRTGQHGFFEAMARKTPEVLIDLRDHVLPVFQKARYQCQIHEKNNRDAGKTQDDPDKLAGKASLPAVEEWADRHHLRPLQNWWVQVQAVLCLDVWARDEQMARRLKIPQMSNFLSKLGGVDRRAPKFEFAADGWWFEFESWKKFEKRVEKEFRRRLKSYRTLAEGAVRGFGYLPTKRKRARSADNPKIHDEWLALRVCKRKTYGEIADLYETSALTDDAVRKAIKRTAESIGLSLINRT